MYHVVKFESGHPRAWQVPKKSSEGLVKVTPLALVFCLSAALTADTSPPSNDHL